ncbi:MAG: aminotransferase class IV, partial [Tateyamaria sp.]
MATGTNVRTYYNGAWHDADVAVMRAADHGSWLGTTVFDGARYVRGLAPDLEAHCARVNRSAEALMITPTVSTEDMVAMVREGLDAYGPDQAVYIRPMYWALDGGELGIVPK